MAAVIIEQIESVEDDLVQSHLASIINLYKSLYSDHEFDQESILNRLKNRFAQGYRLLLGLKDEKVKGLIGYSQQENFAWGDYLYVYDFVIDPEHRSNGLGKDLMGQVEEIAKTKLPDLNCLGLESAMSQVIGTAKSMGLEVQK